ncbi:DUF559 domain-containing protein [Actinoplanes italicus]|nr:DUF559 domain-containing protein [Actinoplanes italicus]
MLRSPIWQRLMHDVYAHRDTDMDHLAWCRAVALILPPGAAIGGLSAARLWGVETEGTQVSVALPRDRWLREDDRLQTHHTTLTPDDVTTVDGIPVTTPERTAFDTGRRLRRADALVVLDAMLHRHLLHRERLQPMIVQRFSWPGITQLTALTRLADPRAESPMESHIRLLLHDARLPPPVPQFEIRDTADRFLGRADLAWPDSALVVEYDGDHHRDRQQFRRDVARLNAFRMAGWTVLRFTADDVFRNAERVAATVSAALTEASNDHRQPPRKTPAKAPDPRRQMQ